MSIFESMIKNIDLPSKLNELTVKLDKEYGVKTGLLIFDKKIYIIDAEQSGEIEIIKEININQLLTNK